MKKFFSFLSILLMTTLALANNAVIEIKTNNNASLSDDFASAIPKEAPIKVYYFHSTRRCATCIAVEDVTAKTIKDNYGDKISFESIDVEENKDNPLIKKYEIAFQTLLIVKGDQVIDLTDDAFLNATTHPEKLAAKIKDAIATLNKE